MQIGLLKRYNKHYTVDKVCTKISDVQRESANFDPKIFAGLLQDAFEKSEFKTWSAVAIASGVKKQTLSRYINAAKQSLTDKPSRPKEQTVIGLAKVLRIDPTQALMAAGYSPFEASRYDEEDALMMSLFFKHSKLTSKQKTEFRRVLEIADHELDRIEAIESNNKN